jgi:hypothetical protein
MKDLNASDCEHLEHLSNLFEDGWYVKQLVSLNGSGSGFGVAHTSGWMFVYLEKQEIND